MNVQQIERGRFGHFVHFGGKRECVGRVIEERVRRDFHLMKIDIFVRRAQPDRHRVTDEMNLVAARSEFDAEFGGHHA